MTRVRSLLARIDPGPDGPPGRRELKILAAIVLLGLFVRCVYAAANSNIALAGDAPGFAHNAVLFSEGKFFWGDLPYGVDHVTAWKAPGYIAWLGTIYSIIGPAVTKAAVIQGVVCGTAVMVLTWLLARRLFNYRIALVAAGIMAIYPHAYEWEVGLYVEALILPLTLLVLVIALRGPPSTKRAIGIGALLGVMMLIRPSSFYLLAGLLAAWWVMSGWRTAAGRVAIAAVCAVLVIVPWTVRNAIAIDGFIPISLQDMAIAGTFNDDSANDPNFPYAWRPLATRDEDLFDPAHPLPEPEIRSEMIDRGREYIVENPESVPLAIFWNGITRLWDIRRPSYPVDESRFEGRHRTVAAIGMAMYYVLAPLAIFGLWRIRRVRPEFFAMVLALAAAAVFVFAVAAHTRYRVGFVPLIVILACAAIVPALTPRARFDDVEEPAKAPSPPEPVPA